MFFGIILFSTGDSFLFYYLDVFVRGGSLLVGWDEGDVIEGLVVGGIYSFYFSCESSF